jgi:hypothetical protein
VTDQPTTEPVTGSVALAEVLADMTDAEQQADPQALAHSDDYLTRLTEAISVIADQLPTGLWKGISAYDRSHIDVPFDLPDIQFTAADVEEARELAKYLPWAEGMVREFVQPGQGYDFYTWAGQVSGFDVWVVGPQPLPTAIPRWWSKPETNEVPAGGDES